MKRWGPGQSMNLLKAAKQDGVNMGPGWLPRILWPLASAP